MSRWRRARVLANDPSGKAVIELDAPGRGQSPLPAAGSTVMVEIRQPRNLRHHRKYWALLNKVVTATGRWPTAEACHRWVKWELRMFVPIAQKNGLMVIEWDSTDFNTMSQQKFGEFYERALNCIALETGIDAESLRAEAGR